MAAVNGSVSVGITVLVVAEKLVSLDYNAYCKELAFLNLSSSWCVHPMKSRLKTGLMEGLPYETVARDGKYETFRMNFQ
jgi:hypothetical protein